MYYEYFGLNYPPFKITPDTRLFYSGSDRGLVLEALIYAIKSGEGIIKVIGEVGSGKTMLCRKLEEMLPKRIEIVYIANPHLPPDMILHAIAIEMRLPITPEDNRLQVMHRLQTSLLEKHENNQQVVVFVEEAQGMPLETLEEIRLLSNLETTRNKLLQIVLFGQPELETHLSIPQMRQLKERITHSFYLKVLTRAHIRDYLHFRLHTAGYRGAPIFSPAAIRLLTKVSKGLMRRVNILADKALLAAFANEVHLIRPKHIRLAARDSGFPCPRFSIGTVITPFIVIALTLGFWFSPYRETLWRLLIEKITVSMTYDFSTITNSNSSTVQKTIPHTLPSIEPLLQQRLQATEEWLAKANKQYYSIQIMQTAGNKTADLAKFLRQSEMQALLEELYIYRVNREGEFFWDVVYSEFADVESAMAAIATFPEILQRNKPFLRNIATLGGELR
ncbi:MAG: AAA family ATPase [Thiomargarita sp.]|nr:AAA family ATPase [Thiomargarita sp.]